MNIILISIIAIGYWIGFVLLIWTLRKRRLSTLVFAIIFSVGFSSSVMVLFFSGIIFSSGGQINSSFLKLGVGIGLINFVIAFPIVYLSNLKSSFYQRFDDDIGSRKEKNGEDRLT